MEHILQKPSLSRKTRNTRGASATRSIRYTLFVVARYISIDEQKKLIPEYTPERAEEFHPQSAKSADKEFMKAVKQETCRNVVLLCGGSASGKTEFYSEYLEDKNAIVFDGTLPTVLGAKNKLRLIEKAKKRAIIYAIIPDDLTRAFAAFLGRDRRFQPEHFYRTHAGSRRTLLWIAHEDPPITIHVVESSYNRRRKLRYRPMQFKNRKTLLAYLETIQYSEKKIATIVHPL